MIVNDKHSSLLQYGINYSRRKFNIARPNIIELFPLTGNKLERWLLLNLRVYTCRGAMTLSIMTFCETTLSIEN